MLGLFRHDHKPTETKHLWQKSGPERRIAAMSEAIGSWRVAFAEGATSAALEPLLLELDAGRIPAGTESVKSNPTRDVLRIPLAGGDVVYVKRSRGGAKRARQEFKNLRRVRALGVRAVEPVLWAERSRLDGKCEALLVTRGEPDARVLRDARPSLDDASLAAARDQLAAIARRLHDAGLWHRDLHAGNVLLVPENAGLRLVLVDLQKLRALPVALPIVLRVADLMRIDRSLPSRPPDPSPLVASYAAAGGGGIDVRIVAARVRAASERFSARRLRSRARRCVKPSSGFRVESEGALRIYRRRDVARETVLAAIKKSAGPLTALEDELGGPPPGPAPDPARRGQGAREPGAPARGAVVLRRFSERGLLRGRGMREWRSAHARLVRGIDLPAPLALVEERRWGLLRRSYLLTRPDAPPPAG